MHYANENLEIKEEDGKIEIVGLESIDVYGKEDIMKIMEAGIRLRESHESKKQPIGCRAHSLFIVSLTQRFQVKLKTGTIVFLECAGSEKLPENLNNEAVIIAQNLAVLNKVLVTVMNVNEKQLVPF
eukprot:CAMPEP_0201285982 /NCGR_PEP_ID=MMETSP1317-20130820/114110_1 /ASSEMBLY_ACC=CAM_ASM_000770 /TAXON_ID=187299 /ORGANISM="Undescribed Undescribed, Strain Undescribed" /LENGTH=126 /DNA_ID=CAMNT_0047612311 /DNA_START=325 /DNA_END=705 /DNA_ORIENTATION=+